MRYSVEVPDAIVHELHLEGAEGDRRGLEMFAIEGYRQGKLSRGQVSEMLEMEFNQTESFLKEHGVSTELTEEEFARSVDALESLLRVDS